MYDFYLGKGNGCDLNLNILPGWWVVSFGWQPGQNATPWANLTFWKEGALDHGASNKAHVVRHAGSLLLSENHRPKEPDAD